MAAPATRVVPLSVSYDDLVNKTNQDKILATLGEAYGYTGLGLVTVSGVPGLVPLRAAALPKIYEFAHLDESVKSQYEDAESFYSFGWSHGKEKLEGKPDLKKGSFYFNPAFDRPVTDEELIKKYPSYCRPNIWPKESDCPGFEEAAKGISQLILTVGNLLAPYIDALAASVDPTYPKDKLTKIIETGKAHKGRLLYYFPADATDNDSVSSWCGFHNDHGSLTGLCPSMYFDPEGKQIPCPDNVAGLYICTRQKEVVLAAVPGDHLAFQIGESAQIHSGGILQATPHAVKASATHGVSRATLAVFMQPQWDIPMDIPEGAHTPEGKERLERGARGELLPPGVPPLLSRFKEGQNFGEFTTATLNAYY